MRAIVDIVRIGNDVALPELYVRCMDSLLDRSRIVAVNYPVELRTQASTEAEWVAESAAIKALNRESLFALLHNGVNCYAIHTRAKRGDWQLRYIGQTDCRRARFNISRHVLPNSSRTDAVFSRCKEAIRSGCDIGLRVIKVEPDTLRYFVQEKAIADLGSDRVLDWNYRRP